MAELMVVDSIAVSLETSPLAGWFEPLPLATVRKNVPSRRHHARAVRTCVGHQDNQSRGPS